MTDPDRQDVEDLTGDDVDEAAEPSDGEWGDEDFDGDPDIDEDLEELDEDLEVAAEGDLVEAEDEADGEGDEESDEALDELEAEELEMLTDDEESETLIVDEAAELRAIRREQLAMEGEAGPERGADEFVCSNCFLVLKRSQLANVRQMLCRDCAP
jgi:Domain of unknown function (DUF4193)